MRNLTRTIAAPPVVLFLIMVLSAPTVTIHHVHRIAANEHADHHLPSAGQAITDVPATYHETHVVTFLSGDSFNSSTRTDIVPSLHKFIAELTVAPAPSGTLSLARLAPVDIRPLSLLSGDKCVLFCSFLI